VWTASKHRRNVSIVTVSSLVGVQGQSQAVSYAAAKAGQIALTKSLAKDLGAEGIRVNCVCPSNVLTPLMTEWASSFQDGNTSAALKLVADKQVLGRLASIEEIGNVALFLASDDASFITGQALVVDGGATLG
jgi:NAD(P)-dependent dehydrogenase (short-subunit alcohol dehydrogenase family)